MTIRGESCLMINSLSAEAKCHIQYIDERMATRDQEWHCMEIINAATVTQIAREEIETHYRNLGFEVKREKRVQSGQRLRGLWLRRRTLSQKSTEAGRD